MAVSSKSTEDLGTSPTTAAVQSAAAAGAQPSAVPPPHVDGLTVAELELAQLRQELVEAKAQLVAAAASEAGGLRHEVFCQPRPGEDTPRLEHIVSDRIHPVTQKSLGKVAILRCLECGVQRDVAADPIDAL